VPATAAAASGPGTAAPAASAAAAATQAPAGAAAAALPSIAEATAKAAAQVAELPATENVAVRQSDIHPIDQAPAASDTMVVASAAAARPETGASSCLTVESDGTHWGFRNKCAFSVQYAYCTMDGRNQLTACKDGFVGGSVAANGFGILVADQMAPFSENHDFRWVACQGGAGEVIARMDKSDPPIGRCMR
jgi:hypothetical protein